jgi:tRNA-binding protein
LKQKLNEITWTNLKRVEMRVGTILEINDFPEAKKPAYQLTIDFGSKSESEKHRRK